jgi:hypothetical protein
VLEEDTKLLMGKQIMDYSLLLAIESNNLIKGLSHTSTVVSEKFSHLRAKTIKPD